MAKKQASQIVELNYQGFSVRDIADALKIDRETVEKTLDESSVLQPLRPVNKKEAKLMSEIEDVNQETEDISDQLIEVAETIESGKVKIPKLSGSELSKAQNYISQLIKIEEELLQERDRLSQEREEFEVKLKNLPHQEETYVLYQQRTFKEKTMARYQYLVDELLNDSSNSRWKGVEVDAYLEQLETLRERLTLFCNYNRIDERRLVIYAGLGYLINLVEGIQKKQTKGLFSGTSVLFNLKEETRDQIKAFTTDSFEKEIETPVAVNPFANLL